MSLFATDMILHTGRNYKKNAIRTSKDGQQGYRIQGQHKNQFYFSIVSANNQKLKIIPYIITLKM